MQMIVRQIPTQNLQALMDAALQNGFMPMTILPALYAPDIPESPDEVPTSFLAEVLVVLVEVPPMQAIAGAPAHSGVTDAETLPDTETAIPGTQSTGREAD